MRCKMTKPNRKWIIITAILLIALLIDLFVIDPLPFVDEIALIIMSATALLRIYKEP